MFGTAFRKSDWIKSTVEIFTLVFSLCSWINRHIVAVQIQCRHCRLVCTHCHRMHLHFGDDCGMAHVCGRIEYKSSIGYSQRTNDRCARHCYNRIDCNNRCNDGHFLHAPSHPIGHSIVQRGRKSYHQNAATFVWTDSGKFRYTRAPRQMVYFYVLPTLQTFICVGLIIAVWLYLCVWIESAGVLTNQNATSAAYVKDGAIKTTRWYNLLALLWCMQFVIACQHIVIAGAVATWFFTRYDWLYRWNASDCAGLIDFFLFSKLIVIRTTWALQYWAVSIDWSDIIWARQRVDRCLWLSHSLFAPFCHCSAWVARHYINSRLLLIFFSVKFTERSQQRHSRSRNNATVLWINFLFLRKLSQIHFTSSVHWNR